MYRKNICNALGELSDIELQRQLWLSDGAGGALVSSFTEVVEELFSDTGLDDALNAGTTGLDAETVKLLRSLRLAIDRVDNDHGPWQTIDDPNMVEVRSMAGKLLELLSSIEK